MSYEVFCQVFAPGTWKWTGKEPDGVGMQLDAAFRGFAAVVNANPGNASTPLSVIRSHADATTPEVWGFTWELGHPVDAGHISFFTESLTLQGNTSSSSSARIRGALAANFNDNDSNGGYGSYSHSWTAYTGLAYVNTTVSYTDVGAILLIAQDTTPGNEFFCWTLKTFGGNDNNHRDTCQAIFKSPGVTGWNQTWVSPRTAKLTFARVWDFGYTGNLFRMLLAAHSSAVPANTQQLRSGVAMQSYDTTLEEQGWFDPPLVRLPPQLFIGKTNTIGPTLNYGKATFPDGVMLQLTQRSIELDVWLWVPSGTSHSQSSPWISPLGLSDWVESKELNFVEGAAFGSAEFLFHGSNFVRVFPHLSALETRLHPLQAALLNSGGGGGGGSGRPSSGLLWPRGTG